MQSKWFGLKEEAIKLRKKGTSIRDVEERLKIPRSTLSGWFKYIKLSKSQKLILHNQWLEGLVSAREKAKFAHYKISEYKLEVAKSEARKVLTEIDIANKLIKELALSMLYLGEGSKKYSQGMSIGNTNPLILKFYITILKENFDLNIRAIKCDLHLRADQDIEIEKNYWSNQLKIPLDQFRTASIDSRTMGRPTYDNYHGVCIVRFGNATIQRKLICLSEIFCEEVINMGG